MALSVLQEASNQPNVPLPVTAKRYKSQNGIAHASSQSLVNARSNTVNELNLTSSNARGLVRPGNKHREGQIRQNYVLYILSGSRVCKSSYSKASSRDLRIDKRSAYCICHTAIGSTIIKYFHSWKIAEGWESELCRLCILFLHIILLFHRLQCWILQDCIHILCKQGGLIIPHCMRWIVNDR